MAEVAIIKAVRWEECEQWSSTNRESWLPAKYTHKAPLSIHFATHTLEKNKRKNKFSKYIQVETTELHYLRITTSFTGGGPKWKAGTALAITAAILILFLGFASHLPSVQQLHIPSLFWYLIITRNSNPAPPASSHRQLDCIFRDLGFSLRGQDSRERVKQKLMEKKCKIVPKVYHRHSPSPMYI